MAYILIKRGKFLEGHSYATGLGYRFHWTAVESEARRFQDNESTDHFQRATGSRVEHRPNNRMELRAIARERVELRNAQHQPTTVHTRINRRAKAAQPARCAVQKCGEFNQLRCVYSAGHTGEHNYAVYGGKG